METEQDSGNIPSASRESSVLSSVPAYSDELDLTTTPPDEPDLTTTPTSYDDSNLRSSQQVAPTRKSKRALPTDTLKPAKYGSKSLNAFDTSVSHRRAKFSKINPRELSRRQQDPLDDPSCSKSNSHHNDMELLEQRMLSKPATTVLPSQVSRSSKDGRPRRSSTKRRQVASGEKQERCTDAFDQSLSPLRDGQHRKRKVILAPVSLQLRLQQPRRSPRRKAGSTVSTNATGSSRLERPEENHFAACELVLADQKTVGCSKKSHSAFKEPASSSSFIVPRCSLDLNQLRTVVNDVSRQLQDLLTNFFLNICLPRTKKHESLIPAPVSPGLHALFCRCWGSDYASVYTRLSSEQEVSSYDCLRALIAAFLHDRVLMIGHALQPKMYARLGLHGMEGGRFRGVEMPLSTLVADT